MAGAVSNNPPFGLIAGHDPCFGVVVLTIGLIPGCAGHNISLYPPPRPRDQRQGLMGGPEFQIPHQDRGGLRHRRIRLVAYAVICTVDEPPIPWRGPRRARDPVYRVGGAPVREIRRGDQPTDRQHEANTGNDGLQHCPIQLVACTVIFAVDESPIPWRA